MTSKEIYHDAQKTESGIWRLLGIGLTIGFILAFINDAILARS